MPSRDAMSTQIIPDQHIRDEACHPEMSFTIRAPAGSGKTELLISRIIRLLEVVDHPKRILAITFTKKASLEMNERLIKRLFAPGAFPHIHARALDLAWPWDQDISPCPIMTIDAWIQSWLQHPQSIHPLPLWLYREAWGHWLSFNTHSHELQSLLPVFDNNMDLLSTWMMDALSKRSLWIFDAMSSKNWSDVMCDRQHQKLIAWQEELLQSVGDDIASIMTIIQHLPSHVSLPKQPIIGDHNAWQQLATWLLTKDSKIRKRFGEDQGFPKGQYLADKKHLLGIISSWDDRSCLLWQYMHGAAGAQDSDLLDATQVILRDLLASLHLTFDRYKACDFTQHLLDALHEVSHHSTPADIEHLLLDEAQDTSQVQIQLLKRLTATWRNPLHTIFIVGDPMQSIYRFRDADVREFMRLLHEGFPHHPLKPLTLLSNFRSSPHLVESLNTLFTDLFPSTMALEEGAIPFTPSQAIQTTDGSIHAYLWQDPEDTKVDPLSYDISTLAALQTSHPSCDTIGVLVRSRSRAHHFIQPSSSKLSLNAVDLLDAKSSHILLDAIEILILALDPGDAQSWLHLLRSRWVGLSLQEIVLLPQEPTLLAWQNSKVLPDDLEPNLRHVLLSYQHSFMPHQAITDSWLQWLQHLGLLSQLNLNEMDVLLNIKSHIDRWASRFITFPRAYITYLLESERLSDDIDSTTTVMSMHKSKGLEFDHLYLPQFDRPSKGLYLPPISLTSTFTTSGSQLLVWHKPLQASSAPSWFSTLCRIQAHYEDKRLLYVALTRAKKSITLSAKSVKNWASYIPYWQQTSGVPIQSEPTEDTSQHRSIPKIPLQALNTPPVLAAPSTNSHFGTLMHMGLYRAWLKTPEIYAQSLSDNLKSHGEYNWLYIYGQLQGYNPDLITSVITKLLELLQQNVMINLLKHRTGFCHGEYAVIDEGMHYRIDRIYLEDDVLWILDYKTSNMDITAPYKDQLNTYETIMKRRFPTTTIKKAIVWLQTLQIEILD